MKHDFNRMISGNKLFFIRVCIFFLSASIFMIFFGNTVHPILSNIPHPFWLNVFFINYTFIGNGLFLISLAAILIFRLKKRKQGFSIFYGFLIAGFLIQLIKNINNLSNPGISFEQGQNIFQAGNVSATDQMSFISGHTALVFTWVTVLCFTLKNSGKQLLLFASAILLGYSRIYLAQNYLHEIFIGALTGIFSAIIAVYLAYYCKGYEYYAGKLLSMHKNNAAKDSGEVQVV